MKRTNLTTTPLGHLAPVLLLLATKGAVMHLSAQSLSRLPPVPAASGPLAIHVAWPAPNSSLTVGNATFVFGTLGDGKATLAIDGAPVAVAANGAWLAWVPVPHEATPTLHLEARLNGQVVTQVLPLQRADWMPERGAWVDRKSLAPVGRIWLPASEPLTLTANAAPGAVVRLRLADGRVVPFNADASLPPVAPGIREFDHEDLNLYRVSRGDHYVGVLPPGAVSPRATGWLRDDTGGRESSIVTSMGLGTLEVIVGKDTTRADWLLDVGRLGDRATVMVDDNAIGGVWRSVSGRPFPLHGTYTSFFAPGTWTHADARLNTEVRLHLADGQIAWVPLTSVHVLASADDIRPALLSSLTLTPATDRTTLRIPLTRPVPIHVDEEDRRLIITLYDAVSIADWTRYGSDNPFVKSVTWKQTAVDQVALTVEFDRPIWGWRHKVDGSDIVFEFRRPPVIDSLRPLNGRRIVIDAGHPPLGACGPTGLCEPEVNLAIANRVRDALARAGAIVTMTRTTPESVSLPARSALAESIDADLFVSIHNNAFPDGVNPFTNNGTATFYNHGPSLSLARLVQRHLVEGFGLPDLGVARGDLSVVRPTWFPAILTEGMYLMVPQQEAALRTPEIQQRYAEGVVAGITDFLREASSWRTILR